MKNSLIVSLAGAVLLTGAAWAQTPTQQPPTQRTPTQTQPTTRPDMQQSPTRQDTKRPGTDSANRMGADHDFVTKAASGGMAEVEMGRMAADKASDPKVKEFAQKMVDDHTKVNNDLKELAGRKSITLPSAPDSKHKATKDRLSKQSGAQFDRAYMEDMVADHRKDVEEFRKESTSGSDPDVKAFAAKALPTLEEHLKQAQETLNQLKK